jgi:hypothetical protein
MTLHSQDILKVEGIISDEYDLSIPYTAIGIPSKSIGTSSNEDGKFSLKLSKERNLLDTLVISSIGFITRKIPVKNFLAFKKKVIILKESVVSLDEITILKTSEYARLAFKNLKENTVSSTHELKTLNRFFTLENDKAKFFIEHYLKVKDKGPSSSDVNRIEIVEGRKSIDYRCFPNVKLKRMYPIHLMTQMDPLRNGLSYKNYKWSKIGDTSYDGEDIIILQGQINKNKIRPYKDPILYIGMDTYKVYKTTNKSATLVYLYQKNKDGKMYLSYHNYFTRQYQELNKAQQSILKTTDEKFKISVRNEVVVLGIETDKKKINTKHSNVFQKNIEDIDVKYNSNFWNTFNFPPPTEFYKKRVKELESMYDVPLETQFNLSNK